eukprot:gene5654-10886_t
MALRRKSLRLQAFRRKSKFTLLCRKIVEQSTKLQSDSIFWKKVRLGRITASVAPGGFTLQEEEPAQSLILKICRLSPPLNVPVVSWRREHEAEAIRYYEGHLQNSHVNLKLEKSGLMLDDLHHFLGASADAIASCECHGKFLVEIICPFKHRKKQCIEECFADKDFCIDSSMKIKKNPDILHPDSDANVHIQDESEPPGNINTKFL